MDRALDRVAQIGTRARQAAEVAPLSPDESPTGPPDTGREFDAEPRPALLSEVLAKAKEPTLWVAEKFLAAGAVGILSGDYYIGKSTAVALFLAHVAAGRPYLGFGVPRALPVMYWSAEGNQRMFAERVACACFHAEIDTGKLGFFFPPPDFVVPFDSQEFARFVVASGCKLVACDSVGYFMNDRADENSASDWKKFVMKPLYAIARETGTSFFLTHHYSKPSDNRVGRHRTRGTSAIGADCDTVLRLEAPNGEKAPERTLFVDKVRNEEVPETLPLTFEKTKALLVRDEAAAGEAPPAPKKNTRQIETAAAKEEADRKAKEDVGLLFRRTPAGLTAEEIRTAFNRRREWVADVLGELHAQGSIQRQKVERQNARGQKRTVDAWTWSEGSPKTTTPAGEK